MNLRKCVTNTLQLPLIAMATSVSPTETVSISLTKLTAVARCAAFMEAAGD